ALAGLVLPGPCVTRPPLIARPGADEPGEGSGEARCAARRRPSQVGRSVAVHACTATNGWKTPPQLLDRHLNR
uniref:hypothetical protein n=1 Tax=Streptomyces otsuchiensis TaxID=2681388 RepID=UPI001D130C69